jgi:hypothetical protein
MVDQLIYVLGRLPQGFSKFQLQSLAGLKSKKDPASEEAGYNNHRRQDFCSPGLQTRGFSPALLGS